MKRVADDFTEQCHIWLGHDIEFNGLRYHLIFGHHYHGGFICIPSLGISCEASDYDHSAEYNAGKLMGCGLSKDEAQVLAMHIEDCLSKITKM